MIKASAVTLFGFFALLGVQAVTAETPPAPAAQEPENAQSTAEEKAVQAYGLDDKTCREWTDGCVICLRTSDAPAACSLPGIACLAHGVQCTGQMDVAPQK